MTGHSKGLDVLHAQALRVGPKNPPVLGASDPGTPQSPRFYQIVRTPVGECVRVRARVVWVRARPVTQLARPNQQRYRTE